MKHHQSSYLSQGQWEPSKLPKRSADQRRRSEEEKQSKGV